MGLLEDRPEQQHLRRRQDWPQPPQVLLPEPDSLAKADIGANRRRLVAVALDVHDQHKEGGAITAIFSVCVGEGAARVIYLRASR